MEGSREKSLTAGKTIRTRKSSYVITRGLLAVVCCILLFPGGRGVGTSIMSREYPFPVRVGLSLGAVQGYPEKSTWDHRLWYPSRKDLGSEIGVPSLAWWTNKPKTLPSLVLRTRAVVSSKFSCIKAIKECPV